MTRSIRGSRRVAVLLAGTAATVLLAAGCGAGQIAETAVKVPGVPGLNAELRLADGGSYKIRNLLVSYPGVAGYPAGGDATVTVAIFNETDKPVTVTVASDGARSVVLAGAAAATPAAPTTSAPASPGATESAQPAPSPTEQPPAGEPARIEIPARGFATLDVGTRQLRLIGLNEALKTGQSVNLVFDFNGQKLTAQAPVAVPLTPLPPAPPVTEGDHE